MNLIEAIIIAIVEGITEYLPVSSTGHMIIASSFMGIEKEEFTKLFEVAIQLGAIMAVVVLYWKKFIDPLKTGRFSFYFKLLVGILPLPIGFLFSAKIDELFESPTTVAVSLLVGGVVLLFIDKAFKNPSIHSEKEITYGKSFMTGLWQCIAMIPGVSRSAASIIGGMQQGLSRSAAAEFSFFLAVPTMAAATLYSLFLKKWDIAGVEHKGYELITQSSDNMIAFAVGNIVAFIVAILAIKFFINYLKKYGFKIFGWYRIIVGIILLILLSQGVIG